MGRRRDDIWSHFGQCIIDKNGKMYNGVYCKKCNLQFCFQNACKAKKHVEKCFQGPVSSRAHATEVIQQATIGSLVRRGKRKRGEAEEVFGTKRTVSTSEEAPGISSSQSDTNKKDCAKPLLKYIDTILTEERVRLFSSFPKIDLNALSWMINL